MEQQKPIDREPEMVDKYGTKWYLDRGASDYASRKDPHGISLDATTVWMCEELNGQRSLCLVVSQRVSAEVNAIQEIGILIDKMKALKRIGVPVELSN